MRPHNLEGRIPSYSSSWNWLMPIICSLPKSPSGSQKTMIKESQFSSEQDHADMTVIRSEHIYLCCIFFDFTLAMRYILEVLYKSVTLSI